MEANIVLHNGEYFLFDWTWTQFVCVYKWSWLKSTYFIGINNVEINCLLWADI
jgi:hypothetical protein